MHAGIMARDVLIAYSAALGNTNNRINPQYKCSCTPRIYYGCYKEAEGRIAPKGPWAQPKERALVEYSFVRGSKFVIRLIIT